MKLETVTEARTALDDLHRQADGRELTPEEEADWSTATAFIERSEAKVAELRALVDRGSIEAGSDQGQQPTRRGRSGDDRGETLRAVENAPYATDSARQHITGLVERGNVDGAGRRYLRAVADPAYLGAFHKLWRDSSRGHLEWSPAEQAAFRETTEATRAMNVGTGSAGGFAVPFQLDPSLINSGPGSIAAMREIARVEQTLGKQRAFVTSEQITAGFAGEATEVDDDSPDLVEVDVPVHRADAFVPVSFEAYEDIPNFVAEISALLADAKKNLENDKFTNGTGTGQPTGLMTAIAAVAGSRVASASVGAFASADVYNLIQALPPRWRESAQWQANLSVLLMMDQMESGNGAKLFTGLDSAEPILLRRRLHENSQLDGSVVTGNDVLLIGDHKQYAIVDHLGARIELVPHLFGAANRPTGQRGILLWWRTGANALVTDAFRLLRVA